MKKTLYNKFDKSMINSLPIATFQGRIIVVVSAFEAEKAVRYLLRQSILGIDTETRPCFRKGQGHQVALLQVATHEECFLFRLNRLGVSEPVKALLEDTRVMKVGLSLKDDICALKRLFPFTPGYFVDLQQCVKEIGIEDMSLQKIYANFFGQKISKSQRLTNWEADTLTEKQKVYAATDAYTCIEIYEELQRLEYTGDYEIVRVDEESPASTNE